MRDIGCNVGLNAFLSKLKLLGKTRLNPSQRAPQWQQEKRYEINTEETQQLFLSVKINRRDVHESSTIG